MSPETGRDRSAQPESRERNEALRRTRRGFLEAVLVVIGAVLVVGILLAISRGAPSTGRDPELTPPAFAPTRAAPTPTPAPAPPAIP